MSFRYDASVLGLVDRPRCCTWAWGAIGAPGGRPSARPAAQDAIGRDGPPRHGGDQPAAGHGGGHPGASAGGQRRRRGDRGQRRARRGRAHVVRPGRRPVRDRLGRQDQKAPRPQRQRPVARRGHDRALPDEGPGADPHPRAAELVGPRLRRRLGPAPPAVRHASRGPSCSRRRSTMPSTASPSARSSPPTGKAAEPELAQIPTSAACFLPGGHAPAAGSVFRNPGLARSLRTIAEGGRDAFYRGPLAEAIVALLAIGGRPLLRGRTSPSTRSTLGRSGLDQLPRLRRLGASSQRPGHRRLADAQPARALRPEAHGLRTRPRRCT